MKTLIVIAKYWPAIGGSEMHSRELAQHLLSLQDAEVCYFTKEANTPNEVAVARSKSVTQIDGALTTTQIGSSGTVRTMLKWLASFYPQSRVIRALFHLLMFCHARKNLSKKVQNADAVHVIYNGVTSISEAALSLAKKFNKPFIFTPLISSGAERENVWKSSRLKRLFTQADKIIALTQYESRWLQQNGLIAEKIRVCPMGPVLAKTADANNFRQTYQLSEKPLVLFLSRHVADKGYELVAQSMAQVWRDYPQTHFIFFGPKSDAAHALLAKYTDPRVVLIESASQQLKTDALAACDCLCVPTKREGLGVVFIEAWMQKKPVIAGDIEILREVINHGENGLLSKHNANGIAIAIAQLVGSPELARSYGINGYQMAMSRYSWPAIAQQMSQIYQQSTTHINATRAEVIS